MDPSAVLLYAAPFGFAVTAARAAAGRRRPRPSRQIRRLVKQSASRPRLEVKQRPGWGPDSKLPPDGLTLEG
jgi:hypothetical protein